MILKKPYAFLIRHFKLIHLLLCLPTIYLIIRTGMIAHFLSTYVNANYYTSEVNLAGTYINYFMYLAIIVIILLNLAIYFLMKQKKKNTIFYMISVVFYIAFFVLLSLCYAMLGSIESASASAQAVRIYRDIAYILYLPQIAFVVIYILRGIGFNLKQFNFDQDIKELEITDLDSEEFEFELGKNNYKYKRNIRRFIREFKYYVGENKFAFTVMMSLFAIVMGTLLYLHFGVYHRTYKQTQNMTHNHLVINVASSVLTNLDQGGNIITDGKYYMAIALNIKNTSKYDAELDYDNFEIEVSKRKIAATLDRAQFFPDMGLPYTRDTTIPANSEAKYVLTYEVDKALLDQPITLTILDSVTYEIGSVTPIYKTVNLSYQKIYENTDVKTVDLNNYILLDKTTLKNTQVLVSDVKLSKSYEYTYNSCTNNVCQNLKNKVSASGQKTLLILKREFDLDTYSTYYDVRKGSSYFVSDFVKVRYKIDDKTYTSTVNDVTPKEINGEWVLEVPERVSYASSIQLLVTFRGSIYSINLK